MIEPGWGASRGDRGFPGTVEGAGPYPVRPPEHLLARPSPLEPDDDELVRSAALGEPRAFAGLVERHGAAVLAVLEKQARDHHTAQDLAQDVWIRVHRALGAFRPGAPFRPWLLAIALNRVRDERRARRGGARAEDRAGVEGVLDGRAAPGRYEPTGRVDESQAIDAALALVPEPFRSALHLVDVLGLDHGEAALALGCAEGTVKSRVHRGRSHFRDHYERLCRAPSERYAARSDERSSPSAAGAPHTHLAYREGEPA